MKYWPGLVMIAIAAWLVYSAMAQRARVLALRREAAARGGEGLSDSLNPGLAILGDIVPPLILTGLAIIGIKMTIAYAVLDAGRIFSLVDLGGFLLLLAGYGTWLVLKTRYREVGLSMAAERPTADATAVAGAPRGAVDEQAA
jgi:hypothetical protein